MRFVLSKPNTTHAEHQRSTTQNHTAVWIAVGGFGFYIAPLWASLWAYMGEHVEMSGKAGTVITVGSGFVPFFTAAAGQALANKHTNANRLGSIVVPTIVGQMMDSHGPHVLIYQQLMCGIGLLVVLVGIVLFMNHNMAVVSRRRAAALAINGDEEPSEASA